MFEVVLVWQEVLAVLSYFMAGKQKNCRFIKDILVFCCFLVLKSSCGKFSNFSNRTCEIFENGSCAFASDSRAQ